MNEDNLDDSSSDDYDNNPNVDVEKIEYLMQDVKIDKVECETKGKKRVSILSLLKRNSS